MNARQHIAKGLRDLADRLDPVPVLHDRLTDEERHELLTPVDEQTTRPDGLGNVEFVDTLKPKRTPYSRKAALKSARLGDK